MHNLFPLDTKTKDKKMTRDALDLENNYKEFITKLEKDKTKEDILSEHNKNDTILVRLEDF